MKLTEYKSSETIFIDANIFIDFSLPNPKYGETSEDFLEKVELGEINAITTPAVLDEVSYILLIYKGAMVLKTQDRQKIRDNIKKDYDIALQCYSVVDKLNEFLTNLKGMRIIPVNEDDYLQVATLGKAYRLLPSDALHASVMKNNNIRNIATRDGDFKRVNGIKVWSP